MLPTFNSTTDKWGRFIEPHYAVIMHDKPMLPMTKYNVLIIGKDNNKPFTRQFSFTTGKAIGGEVGVLERLRYIFCVHTLSRSHSPAFYHQNSGGF